MMNYFGDFGSSKTPQKNFTIGTRYNYKAGLEGSERKTFRK
jgi:hypothetical protein